MMKRKVMLVLAAVFALALSACSPNPPLPTDEQITTAYTKAVEAYSWFDLASMACDSNTSKVQNGNTYYKVTNPDIQTMSDLKAHLETLFSDTIVVSLLDRAVYTEIDGQLYAIDAARGSDITKGEERASITKESDQKFSYNVVVDLVDPEQGETVVGTENYSFPYELINNKWVFTDFSLVR